MSGDGDEMSTDQRVTLGAAWGGLTGVFTLAQMLTIL